MSGGSDDDTRSVSTSEPPKYAKGTLEQSGKILSDFLKNRTDYKYFDGSTIAPLSGQSTAALGQIESLANAGNPLAGTANDNANAVIGGGGLNSDIRNALNPVNAVASGQNQITTGGLFQNLYGQAGQPTASQQTGQGIAQNGVGAQNLTTEADYRTALGQAQGPGAAENYLSATARGDYLNQPNPYLQQIISQGQDDIQNRVKAAASGSGRYGSAAMGTTLARELGNFSSGILASNFENERNRQMSAAGTIEQAQQGRLGQQQGILSGITGVQAGNNDILFREAATRLSAAGQMDSANMAALGQQMNAAQGLTGVQGTNITNQVNSGLQAANTYGQGLNRSLQYSALAPALNDMRYADAARLAGVGSVFDQRVQQQRNEEIDRFNFNRDRDLNLTGQIGNILGANAGQFATQTQTQQQPTTSPVAGVLGGAAAGASAGSIFGPWGAGIGGVLGGIGGAFF